MEVINLHHPDDGKNHRRLRNKSRLIVEVDVIPQNGIDLMGRHVPQGTHRVEIYSDELREIEAQMRTELHDAAWTYCLQQADAHTNVWLEDQLKDTEVRRTYDAMPDDEKKRWLERNCNVRPEHFLATLPVTLGGTKLRTGLPPIKSVSVVSKDEDSSIPLAEYKKLAVPDRKDGYILAAPKTSDNADDRLTEALVAVMRRNNGGNDSGGKRRNG